MIDFTELPKDGIKFEQLIRELLVTEGFEVHWTGVGPDGGRDLVVTERLKGKLSECERKWLVSCKHTANSGKSLGREDAGNISEDCKSIGAEGYILACSTQPTASLVTRLKEIEQNQKIITKFWDSIEIEKRLSKPNTFNLIHTFFPNSSKNYQWKIYNAFSPSFWAANYKGYFFYLSCRLSSEYPPLKDVETIVSIIEKIPLDNDLEGKKSIAHFRLRAIYYDDKHSNYIVYIDYLFHEKEGKGVLNPKDVNRLLLSGHKKETHYINFPIWDIMYREESIESDSFQVDHKKYYSPYIKEFEQGSARKEFLHDIVFQIEMIENLQKERKKN